MSNTDRDPSTNGSGASRPGDEAADIFSNLEALRLKPEESDQIGTAEILVDVPVRKPNINEFVRVHPDPAMSLASSIYIDIERDPWFVAPAMRNILVAGIKPVLLLTTINQRGRVILWPIALGDGTGRKNAWHDTAHQAAETAKHKWIKLMSDMAAGSYRVFEAMGALPDPKFPNKSLDELLRIAFRGRIVDSAEHAIVKQSLGLSL
jgi:hypothetical protein